jgi:drug/metabolite transporter (DMT)-like permease
MKASLGNYTFVRVGTEHTAVHRGQFYLGQGAILLCAMLWSTSGLFIKILDWHPVLIAGSRSFIAVLFLLALRFSPRQRRGGSVYLPRLLGSGFWYAATMILFIIANKLTASANAILLLYTAPVWAGLLGWLLLGEKLHREHWLALVLVSAGMVLVFSGGLERTSLLGDLIALLASLFFAANSVALRIQKNGSPVDSFICSHIITTLCAIPFFCIHPPAFTAGSVVSVLFMGVFQMGFASALFAYGIRRVSAVQAMLTSTVELVLNPLWVLLVTGEKPAFSVVMGGGIIIAAVVIFSFISKWREAAVTRNGG